MLPTRSAYAFDNSLGRVDDNSAHMALHCGKLEDKRYWDTHVANHLGRAQMAVEQGSTKHQVESVDEDTESNASTVTHNSPKETEGQPHSVSSTRFRSGSPSDSSVVTVETRWQQCEKCLTGASKDTFSGESFFALSTSSLEPSASAIWAEQDMRMYYLGSFYSNGNIPEARWAVPENRRQVRELRQQVSGKPQQQLELCRMLAESASLPSRSTYGPSTADDRERQALNEEMIATARRLLQHLAKHSQNIGRRIKGESQFLLANSFGTGALGLPVDYTSAYVWYSQASKQNHKEAIYRTGVCLELGIGTQRDPRRAVKFYRKGASLGHVTCMYKLAMILLRGRCGEARQPREAISWLRRAAETQTDTRTPPPTMPSSNSSCGSCYSSPTPFPPVPDSFKQPRCLPHALHALAMVQLSGECDQTSLIADHNYAIQLLHSAARLGYAPSQCKLGQHYESGQHANDAYSIYWYTLAAQQGEPEAALGLSCWYLTGSNIPHILEQSDRKAYLWVKEAVAAAVHSRHPITAEAFFTTGLYTEYAIGLPAPSISEAAVWYRKAVALGHEGARQQLSKIDLPLSVSQQGVKSVPTSV